MEVYILDSNYEKIGFIDSAESVLWNKKLNDVGECELYLPADEGYINLIENGKYIYREDDEMICEIKTVELETDVENGDYIIVTGHDLKYLLSGRIIQNEMTYSGLVANFIKKIIVDNVINPVQSNRAINNFKFNDSNFFEFKEIITVNALPTKDLLELIKTTCKTFNYGFRVKYITDTKTLEFELFKGVNKANYNSNTYVEFSPDYSNIISSRYKEDNSNYKNVCYVGYKDSKEAFQLLSVFNTLSEPTGENRKEIYVDGTSTSREITKEELLEMFPTATLLGNEYIIYTDPVGNGTIVGDSLMIVVGTVNGEKITVSDYTYQLLIRNIGLNTLASYVKTTEFEGAVDTIDTYNYKIDYDLGDVVKVINEYGIEAEAIITEIMESDDNEDGHVVEPKFEYVN